MQPLTTLYHMFFIRGRKIVLPAILSILLLVILLILPTGFEGAQAYQNADRVSALVLSTDESDVVDTGLIRSGEQKCRVRILGGQFKGVETDAVNRLNGSLAEDKIFSADDKAFVVVSHSQGQITTVFMTDHYRLDKEMVLAAAFILLLLLFAGATGLRAVLSFADAILLLWKVLIPCMLKGFNPILIAMFLVLILTCLILSLIYGLDRRFLAAVSGHGGSGLSVYGSFPDSWCCDGIQRKSSLCRLSASGSDKDLRSLYFSRFLRCCHGSFGRYLFLRL